MKRSTLREARSYMEYLTGWTAALPALTAAEVFSQPETCALISIDVINGFCKFGPLASPRVAGIVKPVAALFALAWQHGVREMILTQDTHEPHAVEFEAWPAHAVRGSTESEAVDELKALPFYKQLTTIPKNSINPFLNTTLPGWLADHPTLSTFVVVGDCTDLCTYQLAMHLRIDANSHQLDRRVIVPVDCVDTYDLPVEQAKAAGVLPHPAEILHPLFLQHMVLNGIEVVKWII